MRRFASTLGLLGLGMTMLTGAASAPGNPSGAPERDVIAVYIGSSGTDMNSGMITLLDPMRTHLRRETAASGCRLSLGGVSIEPTVAGALTHLNAPGYFDEVRAGGN